MVVPEPEPVQLRDRTKQFALRIIRLYSAMPKTTVAQILGKQLLRSGTSVGAHYHEGLRSRSRGEFVSKLEGGLQELQETIYWLELIVDSGIIKAERMKGIVTEANELNAILTTCAINAKKSKN